MRKSLSPCGDTTGVLLLHQHSASHSEAAKAKESAKEWTQVRSAAVVPGAAKQQRLARRHLGVWAHRAAELCLASDYSAARPTGVASEVAGSFVFPKVLRVPSAMPENPGAYRRRASLSFHNAPDRRAGRK